ncbi:SDR family oxidoreductase [Pseudoduganella namucuonensis]|uniref:3-oxoacyl-[acyl-carrier protein] reductase n=1 Tax=Pseudoduganella namucuonensis TaxID=1035707 RepID=A0A1I7INR3_9BURK|nr:SDR family oxidoreductase [Pseudoduganella namucuonensis]SFU74516.1 3-oxoacyl-[acyl-carrier protein] reductase [Pseudoduganella namucuonensis]
MQNVKAALVTGGSRGIGAAIVERLARDGAAVAFTYSSSRETALALAARIEAAGGRALAIQADSADEAQLRAAVNRAAGEFGSLDILVNSAGVLEMGPVDSFPIERLDRSLAVNVRGAFIAIQEALRHMKAGGRIVTIGSMARERVGFPQSSVYAMTKGAVAAMVRGVAIDLGPRGITVNNVQPGPTQTGMVPEGYVDALVGMSPVGRLGRPEEIAGMVAYLVSPEAGYVTGASFTIDGGMIA